VRVVDGPGAQGLAATTPGGGRRRVVEGLDEAMAACYEAWKLPSEMGVGWSARGGKVDLTSYDSFPSK
jgi:hypothetical protein